jgi:hypothetical protein
MSSREIGRGDRVVLLDECARPARDARGLLLRGYVLDIVIGSGMRKARVSLDRSGRQVMEQVCMFRLCPEIVYCRDCAERGAA